MVEVKMGADEMICRFFDRIGMVFAEAEVCPVLFSIGCTEPCVNQVRRAVFAYAQYVGGHEDAVSLIRRKPLLPHGSGDPSEHASAIQQEVAAVNDLNEGVFGRLYAERHSGVVPWSVYRCKVSDVLPGIMQVFILRHCRRQRVAIGV
jgi:hypothetical protein